jgi:hypothetical protein
VCYVRENEVRIGFVMRAFVCRCGSDRGSFLSLLGDGIESEARYWCVVVTLLVRI